MQSIVRFLDTHPLWWQRNPKWLVACIVACFVFVVAICISTVQGCSSKDVRTDAEDSTSLHVAIMPTLDCLPVYYAAQTGIYDSLGLQLRLHNYAAQMEIDTALQRGYVMLAYSDLCRLIVMQQSDTIGIRAVGRLSGQLYLVTDTAGPRPIRRLSNLKGRMLAVARYGMTDYWSDRIAKTARLDTAELFRPNVGSVRIRTDMNCNHTIEAALLPEPYATEAVLRGQVRLLSLDSISPSLAAFVATCPLLEDSVRRNQMSAFMQGYDIAVERINDAAARMSPSVHDSLTVLLRGYYAVPDTLVDSVIIALPQLQPIAELRQSDAEPALQWLRTRDTERAEYRIIRPDYTLDHLIWKHGL